jgi:ATP-dependent Clp protease protease subunit
MAFYEHYFDYGFDIRRRRLFLYGDIDENTISLFIMGLLVLAAENKDRPVEVVMSSCGGDEYEMLAAYDVMRSLQCKVIVTAVGKIMSAAPLILVAADEASCYENTRFMVHESHYTIYAERHGNARATVKEAETLEKIWASKMAERTNLTEKQWLALCRNKPDYYFDSQKALDYGLVDKIIKGHR